MSYYTIKDFNNLKSTNKKLTGQEVQLKEKIEQQKLINTFWSCQVIIGTYEYDNKIHADSFHIELLDIPPDLNPYNVKVFVWPEEYKKQYHFFADPSARQDLKFLVYKPISLQYSHGDNLYSEYCKRKPNNVFTLSAKTILRNIEFALWEYNTLYSINHERKERAKQFYNEIMQYKNDKDAELKIDKNELPKFEGSLVKNGIMLAFRIEDGYIRQNLSIHYTVSKDLSGFKNLTAGH